MQIDLRPSTGALRAPAQGEDKLMTVECDVMSSRMRTAMMPAITTNQRLAGKRDRERRGEREGDGEIVVHAIRPRQHAESFQIACRRTAGSFIRGK